MKILLIFALVGLVASALVYQKRDLVDPSAKCLDGSQGAYYISNGEPSKVLIFFEGGGWCGDNDLSSTIQNCYRRSKSDLGSSTGYNKTTEQFSQGILSDDEDNYFRTWTKVFLKYCDGSGHQGTRSKPILYKGADLYFRGQNITVAQFDAINKENKIYTAAVTHLVLTGQSAGGLATFHWTNYLSDRLSVSTKFWSIPDSGVFIDQINLSTQVNSYRVWFKNILALANEETNPPLKECNEKYKDELWKCMFAQYLHPFIKVPLFTVNSLYDAWSLQNIGVRCLDEHSLAGCSKQQLALVEQNHKDTAEVLFEISSKNQNGVWAPVCVNHCYLATSYYVSEDNRIPANSEYSLMESVRIWMEGGEATSRHIDFGDWPLNRPCSGLAKKSL